MALVTVPVVDPYPLDMVGLTLRRGRQYLRETRAGGAAAFALPAAGQLVAWSRLLFDQEVLVALNTDGAAAQQAEVTVHAPWHPDGSTMRVLYRGDWTQAQLKGSPPNQQVGVTWLPDGRATVTLQLPPAGMAVLA